MARPPKAVSLLRLLRAVKVFYDLIRVCVSACGGVCEQGDNCACLCKGWLNHIKEATMAAIHCCTASLCLWANMFVQVCCFYVCFYHLTWCTLPGGSRCWDEVRGESWSSAQTSEPASHWSEPWLEEGAAAMTITRLSWVIKSCTTYHFDPNNFLTLTLVCLGDSCCPHSICYWGCCYSYMFSVICCENGVDNSRMQRYHRFKRRILTNITEWHWFN